MKELKGLVEFVEVVRRESFADAAKALELSRAAVSKAVAALESELGIRLLMRTTRKVTPTEEGLELFERWSQALETIRDAAAAASDHSGEASGILKMTVATSVGRQVIIPLLTEFRERHPKVKFDIRFEDHLADLVGDRYDLAIRVGALADSSIVAKKLGRIRLIMAASPSYLQKHGEPQSIAELDKHELLTFKFPNRNEIYHWRLMDGDVPLIKPIDSPVLVDDVAALVVMVKLGMGIAQLPWYLVEEDLAQGHLVQILPTTTFASADVFACYPHRQHLPAKTRKFVDFLAEKLSIRLA